MDALLEQGLSALGAVGAASVLAAYCEELCRFNPRYGLVSAASREGIIVRHILDSAAPWKIIETELKKSAGDAACKNACENAYERGCRLSIADIGSGAGLPGIPLAAVLPSVDFTLIEKMAKRVSFLLNAKAVLGLTNLAVVEAQAELAAKNGLRFDALVCRGFAEIDCRIFTLFSKLITERGFLFFYKGRRKKIDVELSRLYACTQGVSARVIPYSVPFLNEERNLVLIRKQ